MSEYHAKLTYRSILLLAIAALLIAAAAGFVSCSRVQLNKTPPIHVVSLHTKSKMIFHSQGDVTPPIILEFWYVSPNCMRVDTSQNGRNDTGIIRNKLCTKFADDAQAVTRVPVADEVTEKIRSQIQPITRANLSKALGSNAHPIGEKKFLNRPCYIVTASRNGYNATYVIDKATGMVLNYKRVYNRGFSTEYSVTAFEPNSHISDAVLNPKLPSNLPLIRAAFSSEGIGALNYAETSKSDAESVGLTPVSINHLRAPSETAAQLQQIMKECNTSDVKQLYYPSYVPSRFKLLCAYRISKMRKTENGRGTIPHSCDGVEINYVDCQTGDSVVILETPHPTEQEFPEYSDGRISTKTDPFPYSITTWKKNGLFFELGATNVDSTDVAKIMESMKPVQ